MKKKIFSLVLAFAFILTGSIYLAGCDKDVKYYYTVELPEHCQIIFAGQTWDDKGFYVLKDESIEFHINVEDGYFSNDFKLFIDSTELTPTQITANSYDDGFITHSYSYSFTPTAEFKIKATGNFARVIKQLTMSKAEYFDETDANNSKLYIRFNQNSYGLPTVETGYADFVKTYLNNYHRNMVFGESFSFDVYYKATNFAGNPSVADGPSISCTSEFYHENGEIGYHFTYTQWYTNANVTFNNFTAQRIMQITTSGNSATQDNISSNKLDITLPEEGNQTLTITFEDHGSVPLETLERLTLKINGEIQDFDFTSPSTNGVFTLTLKNPWEYSQSWNSTSYEIDLNFYDFDYFNGIVELPPIE